MADEYKLSIDNAPQLKECRKQTKKRYVPAICVDGLIPVKYTDKYEHCYNISY